MFDIKSFLIRPGMKIADLENANKYPEKFFIALEDSGEIMKYKKKFDFDHLDGVIIIKFRNEYIMDFTFWDLIYHVWIDFIDLIINFENKASSESFFPDQPLKMSLKPITHNVLRFELGDNEWRLPKKEFFLSLLDSAKFFFEKMIEYFPESRNRFSVGLDKLAVVALLLSLANNPSGDKSAEN